MTAAAPAAATGVDARRSNAFDLLRLVAALLVVIEHSWLLTGQGFPLLPGSSGITVGGVGLGIFFLTSGYLILDSWLADPSLPRFAARRALRILPLFLLVVALTGLVLGPILSTLPLGAYYADPLTRDYLVANLLVFGNEFDLPGVFADAPYSTAVNASLWTISIEILCYVGIAALGLLGVLRSRVLLAVLAVVPVAVFAVVIVTGFDGTVVPRLVGANATPLVAFFAVGMAIRRLRLGMAPPWLLTVLVSLVWPFSWGTPVAPIVAMAVVTALTFSVAFRAPVALHHPTGRTDLSYGIYVLSYPIQQMLVAAGLREGAFVLALTILAVTPLAVLTWRVLESPALRWKPHRPRTAEQAAASTLT